MWVEREERFALAGVEVEADEMRTSFDAALAGEVTQPQTATTERGAAMLALISG